jgi:hypothetical protein
MVSETRGDFANGILFFIRGVVNIHALIILLILFGSTYLFGGQAGEEILMEKKNVLLVVLKYVPIISLALCFYAMAVDLLRAGAFDFNEFKIQATSFYIPLFAKTAFSLFLAWLWATTRIKAAGNRIVK